MPVQCLPRQMADGIEAATQSPPTARIPTLMESVGRSLSGLPQSPAEDRPGNNF